MNGVYVATMYSENYEWTATGRTMEEAVNSIVKEWQEGVGWERRDKMTREELNDYYGINCEFLEFGRCQWR